MRRRLHVHSLIFGLIGCAAACGDGGGGGAADDTLRGARDLGTLTATMQLADSVGPDDEADFFHFRVMEERELHLRLGGAHGDARMALVRDRDKDGDLDPGEIDDETTAVDGVEDTVDEIIPTGDYYIRVRRGKAARMSTFMVGVESAPVRRNGRQTIAEALALGALTAQATQQAFVSNRDPVDFYSFTLSDAADLTLSLDGLKADADVLLAQDGNGNGRVDGNEVLAAGRKGGTASESVLVAALPAGSYLVRVGQFFGETDYTLNLGVAAASGMATPLLNTVPGATLGTAMAQGAAEFMVTGDLTADRAEAYYRFTVTAPGVMVATLSGLTGEASVMIGQDTNRNGFLDLAGDRNGNLVIDDDEIEILGWDLGGGRADRVVRVFLPAGEFVARVLPRGKATTPFGLRTTMTAAAGIDNPFRIQVAFQGNAEAHYSGIMAPGGRSYADLVRQSARMLERYVVRSPFDVGLPQTLVVSLSAVDQGTDTLGSAGPERNERSRDMRSLPTACGCNMNTNPAIEGDYRRVPSYFVDTLAHELFHCLAFGFWQGLADGTSDLIQPRSGETRASYLTTMTRGGATTPTLASVAYGDLLRTFADSAVPVTDDAGAGSDNAHWRIQVFRDEMKVHSGSADGPRTPTSILTLAALRDLGWEMNFGAAEEYVMPQFRPDLSPIHRESAHPTHAEPTM